MTPPWKIKYCLFLSLLLTACSPLGPDFHRPMPPKIKHYTKTVQSTPTASAPTRAGKKQYFVTHQSIQAQWWTVFHSKSLNKLIAEALRANPDLKAAKHALRVAHENTLTRQADFFPTAAGRLYPTRELTARTLTDVTVSGAYLFSLYTPQVNVSYSPDVLGLTRRHVESLKAQEETIRFQQEAIFLTLTSNVVLAAIQEASLRAQIHATKRGITVAAELLTLMKQQHKLGQIGAALVAAQESLLARVQKTLPPLEKALEQQRHLITVLCGHFPSDDYPQHFTLDSLTLPRELPLSLPSQLVEQRPDIRAAEAQMHQASALVGVAFINRLPSLTLTAYAGSHPLTLATIFGRNTSFWGIGANVAQYLLDGGALLHAQRAAVAAFEQTSAEYRSVVLVAFQSVADTLSAIQADARALKAAAFQLQAAHKSYAIAKQQWQLGSTGYMPVLNAEQDLLQAHITLAQNQANRFSNTAALFQALGGGWWQCETASSCRVVTR